MKNRVEGERGRNKGRGRDKGRGILKSELRVKCLFSIRNAGASLSLQVVKSRRRANDTFLHVHESHRIVEVRMTDRKGIEITGTGKGSGPQ